MRALSWTFLSPRVHVTNTLNFSQVLLNIQIDSVHLLSDFIAHVP